MFIRTDHMLIANWIKRGSNIDTQLTKNRFSKEIQNIPEKKAFRAYLGQILALVWIIRGPIFLLARQLLQYDDLFLSHIFMAKEMQTNVLCAGGALQRHWPSGLCAQQCFTLSGTSWCVIPGGSTGFSILFTPNSCSFKKKKHRVSRKTTREFCLINIL